MIINEDRRESPEHDALQRPILPMHIEGGREEVAEEISQVGPEGRPADPKAGPGWLAADVAFVVVLLAIVSLTAGLWLGWTAGLAALAIAMIAVAFNPVALAALQRMKDKRMVADRHALRQHPQLVRRMDIDRYANTHSPV